ncbi:unnamed protein product, partial [Effrenium voratum]
QAGGPLSLRLPGGACAAEGPGLASQRSVDGSHQSRAPGCAPRRGPHGFAADRRLSGRRQPDACTFGAHGPGGERGREGSGVLGGALQLAKGVAAATGASTERGHGRPGRPPAAKLRASSPVAAASSFAQRRSMRKIP